MEHIESMNRDPNIMNEFIIVNIEILSPKVIPINIFKLLQLEYDKVIAEPHGNRSGNW